MRLRKEKYKEKNYLSDSLRKITNFFPPITSAVPILFLHVLQDRKRIIKCLHKINLYKNKLKREGIYTNKEKDFLKTLKKYCVFLNYAGGEQYIDSYLEYQPLKELKRVKRGQIKSNDPILICCVYNDFERIKEVYYHHKSIGVNNMVFVDNCSDDGTLEWLLLQDVDVYQTNEKYHAGAKSSWVRKIQDIYGYNRWYLVVDSDELFTYIGMEQHPICDLIMYAEKNGIYRIRAFLLDMYPSHSLYKETEKKFIEDYVFFDKDTYWISRYYRGIMIRGGPRTRVLTQQFKYSEPLTKYPLIYVTYGDAWADHTPLPFKKNFDSECVSVLRHYKFLNGDYERYKNNAVNGNYNGGSMAYKMYTTDNNKELSFFYEKSVEYENSNSLRAISFMKMIF